MAKRKQKVDVSFVCTWCGLRQRRPANTLNCWVCQGALERETVLAQKGKMVGPFDVGVITAVSAEVGREIVTFAVSNGFVQLTKNFTGPMNLAEAVRRLIGMGLTMAAWQERNREAATARADQTALTARLAWGGERLPARPGGKNGQVK